MWLNRGGAVTEMNSSISYPANAAPFVAARDFLLRHREDYATAYRDFQCPKPIEFAAPVNYLGDRKHMSGFWCITKGAGQIAGIRNRNADDLGPLVPILDRNPNFVSK